MTRDSDRCAKPGCGRERRRHAERFVRPVGHAFVPPEPTPGDGEDVIDEAIETAILSMNTGRKLTTREAMLALYDVALAAGRKAAFGEAAEIARQEIRDAIAKAGER